MKRIKLQKLQRGVFVLLNGHKTDQLLIGETKRRRAFLWSAKNANERQLIQEIWVWLMRIYWNFFEISSQFVFKRLAHLLPTSQHPHQWVRCCTRSQGRISSYRQGARGSWNQLHALSTLMMEIKLKCNESWWRSNKIFELIQQKCKLWNATEFKFRLHNTVGLLTKDILSGFRLLNVEANQGND